MSNYPNLHGRLKSVLNKGSSSSQIKKSAAGRNLQNLVQKKGTGGISGVFKVLPKNSGYLKHSAAKHTSSGSGGFFNSRQMELSVDKLIASSLVNGRQTSGVLRTLFGIVPNLIGR